MIFDADLQTSTQFEVDPIRCPEHMQKMVNR